MPELQSSRLAQMSAPPRWAVSRSSRCTGEGPNSRGKRSKSSSAMSEGDPLDAVRTQDGLLVELRLVVGADLLQLAVGLPVAEGVQDDQHVGVLLAAHPLAVRLEPGEP